MIEELINTWKEGKRIVDNPSTSNAIIINANAKKKSVLNAHLGTILVLAISFMVLSFFFYVKGGFAESLSYLGIWFMLGSLGLRIIIECVSIAKSKTIQVSDSTDKATEKAHSFYTFRKRVHGSVSIGIVAFYVVGFYALAPEFSTYIPLKWMIAIHLSFLAGSTFLLWVARRGIRKEMKSLSFLTNLRQEIHSNENTPQNNSVGK